MAEVHVEAGAKHTFIDACRKFGGRYAAAIGALAFVCLGYSLLAAYSAALLDIFEQYAGHIDPLWILVFSFTLLSLPVAVITRVNKPLLFVALLTFMIFGAALLYCGDVFNIRRSFPENPGRALSILPAIFTSFGCQIVIAPIVDYCRLNVKEIRRVLFYGNVIPLCVYGLWVTAALGMLWKDPAITKAICVEGQVSVAAVMHSLSSLLGGGAFEHMVKVLAFFSVLTSFVGVGVGLVDAVSIHVQKLCGIKRFARIVGCALVVIPAWWLTFFSRAAFVELLSVAGAINTVIAVFLPLFLVKNIQTTLCGSTFQCISWKIIAFIWAIVVVASEVFVS